MKRIILVAAILLAALVAGCGGGDEQNRAYKQVDQVAKNRSAYIPHNDVEFNNYNEAQKLYDSPTTIIWCTAFPENTTAPLVTVPIAGKLTSSTTTYFDPQRLDKGSGGTHPVVLDSRSVDGMYHPNPPQYRYGFTPGGQYVDFFNMPTLCTTKPLEFQRQSVTVKVDGGLQSASNAAEEALKSGDKSKAQQILEGAAGQ